MPAPQDLDRFDERVLVAARHIRRNGVIYSIVALAALAVGLFPVISGGGTTTSTASGAAAGSGTGGVNFSATPAAAAGGAGPAAGDAAAGATTGAASSSPGAATSGPGASGPAPGGSAAAATASGGRGGASTPSGAGAAPSAGQQAGAGGQAPQAATSGGSATVLVGSGTTAGGTPCGPNVRQLPYSTYAAPCEAHYTGSNGGATYNGVTASTINLVYRHTADSTGANAAANQAQAEAAGGVSYDTGEQYVRAIIGGLNKSMELYGRQVKLIDYNGQGNNTNETLGQDQAAACADADAEANTLHAFAAMNYEGLFEPDVFSQCAARYHLYVPLGSAYYPESSYAAANPYVWATTMNCTLITQEFAEFVGKQVQGFPAKYAGNDGVTSMKGAQRKFAIYVPNNAGYQSCAATFKDDEVSKYGVASNRFDQYNYALDISTFPQDAQRGIVQFAANRDTTIVMACDPVSMVFLTQDAQSQNYAPEWLNIGVANDDTDNYGQLWNQQAITGRLFGLSQLGSTKQQLDPNGEAARFLKSVNLPVNITSVDDYYGLLSMYNQIQAAGPDLTPANIAAGSAKLPPAGGANGAVGSWYFGTSHTEIDDSREIYWDANASSPANGNKGSFIAVYNGARFGLGKYPTGEPPVYPGS